eukprot:1141296-Pelagomonas_calceolata.AAC.3
MHAQALPKAFEHMRRKETGFNFKRQPHEHEEKPPFSLITGRQAGHLAQPARMATGRNNRGGRRKGRHLNYDAGREGRAFTQGAGKRAQYREVKDAHLHSARKKGKLVSYANIVNAAKAGMYGCRSNQGISNFAGLGLDVEKNISN